jgi:hypothetical protein
MDDLREQLGVKVATVWTHRVEIHKPMSLDTETLTKLVEALTALGAGWFHANGGLSGSDKRQQ